MDENKKCMKCKRTIPKEEKVKVGLCPKCFNEVGSVGAVISTAVIVCVCKKLMKNSGK